MPMAEDQGTTWVFLWYLQALFWPLVLTAFMQTCLYQLSLWHSCYQLDEFSSLLRCEMSSSCSSLADYRMGSWLILLFLSKTCGSNLFQHCLHSTGLNVLNHLLLRQKKDQISRGLNQTVDSMIWEAHNNFLCSSHKTVFLIFQDSLLVKLKLWCLENFPCHQAILQPHGLWWSIFGLFPRKYCIQQYLLNLFDLWSMTWSGGSLLKRPADLWTLNFPLLKLSVNTGMSNRELMSACPTVSKVSGIISPAIHMKPG